jgi:hypothetical protein
VNVPRRRTGELPMADSRAAGGGGLARVIKVGGKDCKVE